MMRAGLAAVLAVATASAETALKPGWTPVGLTEANAACTEELVQGVWRNTKRDQGIDPARPLTPELRTQLGPQIKVFEDLCVCVVRETATRYGKADIDRGAPSLKRVVTDLVTSGVCKPTTP